MGVSLSKKDIDELKELYRKNYGIVLNDQQTLDKGLRLILLVETVLKEEYRKRTSGE